MLCGDLRYEDTVSERIQRAVTVWSAVKSGLTQKWIPLRAQANAFPAFVIPSLLYGPDTCAILVRQMERLQKFQNVMLRRIYGAHWTEKITNDRIRADLGVAFLTEIEITNTKVVWSCAPNGH